ncbi:MAG: DUF5117 domain-containing protein [Acidobacteria bacterium]|nr:DUF5117 domain-containing protein [Acidobacteriota bacterium]
MRKMQGFFPLYWDAKAGNLFLEIERMGEEFLYYTSLAGGLGSNDVGLDRNQIGQERILRFDRVGPKILLVEKNLRYRANTPDAAERRAVEDAFAQSTHWGFSVAAEDGDRVLIDITPFVLRDGHRAADRLRMARSGTYRVDASRSALYLDRTRSFPDNTEIEVSLTFAGEPQGRYVRSVSPDAESITLREHYSFVRLPDGNYKPRAFDTRSSFFPTEYADYAAPLGDKVARRLITRHRLERKASGEAVKPIVYYVDNATPEPIRTALVDGARWWNQAFEAAGFRDAFQVRILPADADPLDIRYNMIHWVHRSTRGWSYGGAVIDPRTGEILKGNVTLGSLRMRQDYMIAEGLLAPYGQGKPANPAMREMALARIRQLSAHEVGHTLGLTHNFASSVNNRASVMDYPHPLIGLKSNGEIDLASAYATGIGEWDKVSISYGYSAAEPAALDKVLRDASAKGLRFIADDEARDPGGSNPVSHLWDNNANAVDELNRVMDIRDKVLARFSADVIKPGEPMSAIGDTLVPIYLMHRYQTEAAAKSLGGVDYNYALRGDGQFATKIVPAAEQRRALEALLRTLAPQHLDLSEKLLAQIPPIAYGYDETREQFRGRTGRTFDPVAAAESAANHSLGLLLHADRAARLDQLRARDNTQPGFAFVIERLLAATWNAPVRAGMQSEIQKAVNMVALHHLMALAANEQAAPGARAQAAGALRRVKVALTNKGSNDASWEALYRFAIAQIDRFERDPKVIPVPKPLEPPPGQPIGCLMPDPF